MAFEVSLNTVIDCLNIFGTAGPTPSTGSGGSGGNKRWKKQGEGSGNESGEDDDIRGRGNRIEPFIGTSEKHTGMRMTYAGGGYPLTLLMYVHSFSCGHHVH